MEQALARVGGGKRHQGEDAARAVLRMAELRRQLSGGSTRLGRVRTDAPGGSTRLGRARTDLISLAYPGASRSRIRRSWASPSGVAAKPGKPTRW
jgi:hypothetical protein